MRTPEPFLLDRKTAALLLSVSIGTIDRLVKQGELRACHVQRRVLFSQSTLKAFAARKSRSQ